MSDHLRLPTEDERRRALSPVLAPDQFESAASLVEPEFGSCSRAGVHRHANEDHYLILRLGRTMEVISSSLPAADLPRPFDEHAYAVGVADGSGDFGAGALASRVALSTLAQTVIQFGQWNLRIDTETAEDVRHQADFFTRRTASAIKRHRVSAPFLASMRSTLTAIYSAGDQLFFATVGDSRAYLLRGGTLIHLTRPHDQDALGNAGGDLALDIERIGLSDNDIALLCTSSLARALDEDTIADLLSHPRSLDDQCRQLVDLAVGGGCEDDVTAVAVKYRFRSPRVPPAAETE